jgi:hypothetical protein
MAAATKQTGRLQLSEDKDSPVARTTIETTKKPFEQLRDARNVQYEQSQSAREHNTRDVIQGKNLLLEFTRVGHAPSKRASPSRTVGLSGPRDGRSPKQQLTISSVSLSSAMTGLSGSRKSGRKRKGVWALTEQNMYEGTSRTICAAKRAPQPDEKEAPGAAETGCANPPSGATILWL